MWGKPSTNEYGGNTNSTHDAILCPKDVFCLLDTLFYDKTCLCSIISCPSYMVCKWTYLQMPANFLSRMRECASQISYYSNHSWLKALLGCSGSFAAPAPRWHSCWLLRQWLSAARTRRQVLSYETQCSSGWRLQLEEPHQSQETVLKLHCNLRPFFLAFPSSGVRCAPGWGWLPVFLCTSPHFLLQVLLPIIPCTSKHLGIFLEGLNKLLPHMQMIEVVSFLRLWLVLREWIQEWTF